MPFVIIGCLIIFAMIICAVFNTPQGRGFLGERYIRFIIGKNKKNEKYVINNLMITDSEKSSQIDHVVINKNGIFVIETKNYSGRIYGNESQQEWTQVLNYGKIKNKFYNPIKQNATHIYRLSKLLPKDIIITSVIVFIKGNTKYINADNVISPNDLKEVLHSSKNQTISPDEMKQYYDLIIESKSNITSKEHINEIKQIKTNVNMNICPRCGANLVLKNEKYGSFYGCENYPKCRFIKK